MATRKRAVLYQERVSHRRALLKNALDRFVAQCRELHDVRAVYVFGSLGSGHVGPRSDLDLLVIRDTTIRSPIERAADLVRESRGGVGVDVVVVTPLEFEALPASSFGRTILQSSQLVYAA